MHFIQKLTSHKIVKGTTFVFLGSFVVNISNYLFHMLTGRFLGPEQYALIAALLSLSYVIGFPSMIISTVTSRKIAELAAKDNEGAIHGVLRLIFKYLFILAISLIVFILLLQKPIADFLKIQDSSLVVVMGISLAIAFFSTVTLAALQGMLRFISYAIVSAINGISKVSFAIIAIVFGFGSAGVIWGLLATSIVAVGASLVPLHDVLRIEPEKQKIRGKSINTTLWVAAAFLGMGLMINVDVLLVKHFFTSYDAGLYAALATIGKIVLFLSSSISLVLLPIATQKIEKGETAHKELLFALSIIIALSLSVIGIYIVAPRLVIQLLYGSEYFKISNLLWMIGLYFLFYNIAFLLIHYYISAKKYKILIAPLIIAIFQIFLVYLFHDSFDQILIVLISTAAILSSIFLGYYFLYETKK